MWVTLRESIEQFLNRRKDEMAEIGKWCCRLGRAGAKGAAFSAVFLVTFLAAVVGVDGTASLGESGSPPCGSCKTVQDGAFTLGGYCCVGNGHGCEDMSH